MKMRKEYYIYSLLVVVACFTIFVHLYISNRSSANPGFHNGKHAVHYDDLRLWRRSNIRSDDALIACDRNSQNSQKKCSMGKMNETNVMETKMITIPEFYEKHSQCSHRFEDTVTFFHVGKAGGGTIKRELQNNHMSIKVCHPIPSICNYKLQKGLGTTLIINVRDPVDRFVSAFRWRSIGLSAHWWKYAELCNPDDKRERTREAWQYPFDNCNTLEEEQMLRVRYQSDPNMFAEALCMESPLHKNANEDYRKIGHSMPLSVWLDFLTEPRILDSITDDGIQNFIALPLEKQGDNDEILFDQHIQHLSLHLLQTRYEQEKAKDILKQKPQDDGKGKHMCQHSSVRVHDSTNPPAPSVVSPLGECCLARYLQEDYRLIQTMIGDDELAVVEPLVGSHPVIRKACSWGSDEQRKLCRSDLRSMLLRRAQYLDRSLGTCSKVVAMPI